MVTRIYPGSSDFENLSLLRIHASTEANEFDYSRVVVPKPWGYEYLWFQNSSVAVWMLRLAAGQGTSLHCHTRKRTSLIVMTGAIVCATIDSRYRLNAGDSAVLEPCVFHSSSAVSDEGVFLMEVETPPLKGDLIRFRDSFGRAGQSYESASQYSTDFDSFDYEPLGRIPHDGNPFNFKGHRLQFSTFQRSDDFRTKLLPGGLLVPMLGRLVFGRTVVADIGEAISTEDILLDSCPAVFAPVELLQVAPPVPKAS